MNWPPIESAMIADEDAACPECGCPLSPLSLNSFLRWCDNGHLWELIEPVAG